MSKRYAECAFTEWFCNAIERVNGYTVAFVGNVMQQRGLPDRYVCHKTWRGWVEFKADGGAVKTNQRVVLQALLDRGDHVLVVRALESGNWYAIERVPPVGHWCGDELACIDVRPMKTRELDGGEPVGVALIRSLAEAWQAYELSLI